MLRHSFVDRGALKLSALRPQKEIEHAICSLPLFDPYSDTGDSEFEWITAAEWVWLWENTITHIEGPLSGQPYILQEHELGIIANYFGWIREKGTNAERRRFSEIFYLVGQGNSKTTWLAGLTLLILVFDREPNAQILGTANSREQAGLLQRVIKGMILNKPDLESRTEIYQNTVVCDNRVYTKLAAKDSTAHGYIPYFSANDEVHAHLKPAFLEVVKKKSLKRADSTIVYISTADWERQGSICNTLHDRARQILRGDVSAPYFLPAVFEITPEMLDKDPDCWKLEKNWYIPNPLLAKALSLDKFRESYQEAIESPALLNEWLRLCMNIRTKNEEQLLSMGNWVDRCGGELDISKYEGKQAVGAGLDLGNTSDLNAFCLIFECESDDDREFDAFWWHWTPIAKAEERQRQDQGANYTGWAKDGWMKLTPGNETSYSTVSSDINEIGQRFGIPGIHVDRNFQGAETCQRLRDDYGFNIAEFGQGHWSMGTPTKYLIDLVNKGLIHHGNNPLIRWQAANLQGEMDAAGSIKPSKARSGNKIDGMVALIMALAMALPKEGQQESMIEKMGGIQYV